VADHPDLPPWPPEVPPWRPVPERRELPRPPGPPPLVPTVAVPSGAPPENVFDRLLERRIVLVTGRLDDSVAALAAAQLMLLDASGDEPVELRLSCPDGDLDACVALADTVDLAGLAVRAVCSGSVGGPALAPLAAADRRVAHPHCLFVLRDPAAQLQGRADELATSASSYQRQLDGLPRPPGRGNRPVPGARGSRHVQGRDPERRRGARVRPSGGDRGPPEGLRRPPQAASVGGRRRRRRRPHRLPAPKEKGFSARRRPAVPADRARSARRRDERKPPALLSCS
jgi:ATP-dependent Clp protease protease subunit